MEWQPKVGEKFWARKPKNDYEQYEVYDLPSPGLVTFGYPRGWLRMKRPSVTWTLEDLRTKLWRG